jgi:D-sedoheptulose 7-phosphate isomerase
MPTRSTVGLVTVALIGRDGRKLKEHVRYCICVPADETPRIQEVQILIGHILSQIVEVELFGK